MYSFLLIGQSNMAGRGFKEEVSPIASSKLHVLRNGKWQQMYVPVHCDRPFSGICLAESFAYKCFEEYGSDIGLIPCADGGSMLSEWQPGESLYDHAVFQAKLAMRTSRIAGVLWHQGEADCGESCYLTYEKRCINVFENLKKDLNLTEVPFLVGGLGDFLSVCPLSNAFVNYYHINDTLKQMEEKYDYIGFVSAEGLTSNPDLLHFNAKSLREFGERYFNKFKTMNKIIIPGNDIAYVDDTSELKKL